MTRIDVAGFVAQQRGQFVLAVRVMVGEIHGFDQPCAKLFEDAVEFRGAAHAGEGKERLARQP